jgi:hypothetical protein
MAVTFGRPKSIAYKVIARHGDVTIRGPVRPEPDRDVIKAKATDRPTKRRAKAKA